MLNSQRRKIAGDLGFRLAVCIQPGARRASRQSFGGTHPNDTPDRAVKQRSEGFYEIACT
jgi:hypothetical protein